MNEVESRIDLKDISDAREWASEVMVNRPYRKDIFELFCNELVSNSSITTLELGSGPGHLAKEVISKVPNIEYTAYDFSSSMHFIAKEHLKELTEGVNFIVGSFKESGWDEGLGKYDAIITMQAVHEIRHKNNTLNLFNSVKGLLKPQGIFLYCDHVSDENGMKNSDLFMNEGEQLKALEEAKFNNIEKLVRIGSLVLWKGMA